MFLTESEQWAEDYGEHVGYCRTHQQRVLDSCDQCADEEHDCEWISLCCGTGWVGGTDLDYSDNGVAVGFCAGCRDVVGFECNDVKG